MKHVIAAHFLNEKNQMLILKRAPDKKWFPNQWDVVAGKIENGESPKEAMQREVQEEISIHHSGFTILKEKTEEEYSFGNEFYTVFLFLCQFHEGNIVLNKEHTEWKWVSFEQLREEPLCHELSEPFKKDLKLFFGM